MILVLTHFPGHPKSLTLLRLLRNGLGPFGYEFVVRATQAEFDEHWDRSNTYADALNAHVYCCNISVLSPAQKEPKQPKLPAASDKVRGSIIEPDRMDIIYELQHIFIFTPLILSSLFHNQSMPEGHSAQRHLQPLNK